MAQSPRAILLASAMATNMRGLRASIFASQDPSTVPLRPAQPTTAIAPTISKRRISRCPTLRNNRGYARQEWQKMREHNQALDIRVYARAAAWVLGADRFDERMWQNLEKQAGVETTTAPDAAPETSTERQAGRVTVPRQRGWRVSTPKYME